MYVYCIYVWIDYVQVYQKHTLDLSEYSEEPTQPINPSANTEMNYLRYVLKKYLSQYKYNNQKSLSAMNVDDNGQWQ